MGKRPIKGMILGAIAIVGAIVLLGIVPGAEASVYNFTNGTINASGNVGIGTTNPGAYLDVNGSGTLPLMLETGSAGPWSIILRRNDLGSASDVDIFNSGGTFYVKGNGSFTGNLSVSGTVGGTYTGALAAGNVSAGIFGSNTGGGSYSFPTSVTWGDGSMLSNDANGAIELGPSVGNGSVPFIDMHYGTGAAQDYNVRLQNNGNNEFSIITASNGMVFTVNGGNVGVGTSAPSYKLDVQGGDARIYGSRYSQAGDTANLILGDGFSKVSALYGQGISISPYGTTNPFFVQQTTGNVGIGTTSPSQLLEVNGNAKFDGTVTAGGFSGPLTGTESAANVSAGTFGGNTGGGNYTFPGNLSFSGANPSITSGGSYITIPNGLYVSGGTPYFQTQVQARAGIHNDSAAYLELDGGTSGYTYVNGSLGIGTATPGYTLEVDGTLGVKANSTSLIYNNASGAVVDSLYLLTPNTTAESRMFFGPALSANNTGILGLYNYSAGSASNDIGLGFYNHEQLFNVLANGNVGIGTTSPGATLEVNGNVKIDGTVSGAIQQAEFAGCTVANSGNICYVTGFWSGGGWGDTNYTPVCVGNGSTYSRNTTLWVVAKTNTYINVGIQSVSGSAGYNTVDCIAEHW